jgi:predicted nucleotide-binding protein
VGGAQGRKQRPRARQNVILELGYFIGRLGRSHVCALKAGDLELPSDILGVAWTPLDPAGAWKQRLAKELDAAGYHLDWNKVMRA